MMHYQARIYARHLRKNPGATRIPAILPVVVYNGDRPWTAATDLHDLIDLDPDEAADAHQYLPHLRYRLDDLTQIDTTELRARATTTPELALMLVLLTTAPNHPHPRDLVNDITDEVAAVARGDNAKLQLQAAFTYIGNVVNSDEPIVDLLKPIIDHAGPVAQEALMTIADQLRAEGRTEGRAEGRIEGQAHTLLRMLARQFGPLPDHVVTHVQSATRTELDTWSDRLFDATTLEDVFA